MVPGYEKAYGKPLYNQQGSPVRRQNAMVAGSSSALQNIPGNFALENGAERPF